MSVPYLARRYEHVLPTLTSFYMTHPDAEVYAPEYRPVLARCMANKIAYGVTYGEDIEVVLKRFNQWHGITTKEESQGLTE